MDLNDGGLHEVALAVVTVAPGEDGEARGGPGIVQPLLDAGKGLQRGEDPGVTPLTLGYCTVIVRLVHQAGRNLSEDIGFLPVSHLADACLYLVINHSREEGAEVFHGLEKYKTNITKKSTFFI